MVAVSFVLVLALVSSTVWTSLNEKTPTPTSDQDPVDIGLLYILQQLNLKPDEFKRRTNFTDRFGVTHLYGMPLHQGLLIENLHAAAHIKNSRVFFYSATKIVNSHTLTKRSPQIPKSRAEISSKEAVKAAVDCLGIPFYNDILPVMESYSTSDGDIFVWKFQLKDGPIPVWKFLLRDDPMTRWIEVKVDANTGGIVSKKDVKRDFTYTVVKLPNENPHDGFSTILNPENFQASPNGWSKGYKLKGNNVLVNYKKRTTFKTTTRGVFSASFDPTSPPQTPKNLVAGAINAFYVANMVHDVFYAYGFTEPAGNFQQNNFNKGGIGGDPVIINVQSSKRKNYAHFDTPFDGHPGVLDLHIYTATEPNRDPALDNTILTHELTHGLSERLTGGARTKMCMSKTESGGLSEGYSDMVAIIFTTKPEDTRNTKKVIAEYVEGDQRGIRDYPYTTDIDVNPLTYQDAIGEKDPHRLGEIWAVMLWEVYWNLVDEYGFSANLHDATQEEGNIIFLQLFVGTLMIQPCNPTFDSARRAMLAADNVYYNGVHEHLIREGFAKRGLGSIS
ncbi:hypothetical protein BSLG_010781 [Batrachochytrium salamandrivorans]|nr:hypothetical protein BSLG_010781 [Batrachochytrium salamandrivorans]